MLDYDGIFKLHTDIIDDFINSTGMDCRAVFVRKPEEVTPPLQSPLHDRPTLSPPGLNLLGGQTINQETYKDAETYTTFKGLVYFSRSSLSMGARRMKISDTMLDSIHNDTQPIFVIGFAKDVDTISAASFIDIPTSNTYIRCTKVSNPVLYGFRNEYFVLSLNRAR